ncbi:MAG: hypothetical protein CMH61_01965 [Nanoarchaeota archaeon]|nr:hypothetical protein [Nanoarchaeota archaeon]|tara:strand:- start:2563 stop:2958 length:396 start_codon:yes stop_codon:yes gene_type:complete
MSKGLIVNKEKHQKILDGALAYIDKGKLTKAFVDLELAVKDVQKQRGLRNSPTTLWWIVNNSVSYGYNIGLAIGFLTASIELERSGDDKTAAVMKSRAKDFVTDALLNLSGIESRIDQLSRIIPSHFEGEV